MLHFFELECFLNVSLITFLSSATGQPSVRPAAVQSVRTKEEKEVLDHFAGVFTMMNPQTFKEVFSVSIDFMVERIYNNYALQIVANSFLANVTASATFATILVEYLLERMSEMGSNVERSVCWYRSKANIGLDLVSIPMIGHLYLD